METDMTFQDFGHKSIDGTAASGDGLQHFRALLVTFQPFFNRADLSLDSPDTIQEFFSVLGGMRHSLQNLIAQ
jgi:hypothetical protein